MTDQANKKKDMQNTVLSSGVELGAWAAPSGCTLPTLSFSEVVHVVEDRKDSFSELVSDLEKPSKKPSENSISAEVLNESLD